MRHLSVQACVLADAIRLDHTKSGVYQGRAHVLARAGRFDEALADFSKAIELDPSVHWPWYFRGCILAHAGQSDAYRAHCRAMLRQFGSTTDPYVADRTAKTCMLLPDATGDLAGQLRLVDVVFARGKDEGAMPWFRLLKGLAEYRQGHYGAAIDWLEQSRATLENKFVPARATASLLLAMVHHRLGHAERARSLFAEARHSMDRDLPGAGAEDLDPVNVEDWLISHVIRREAEDLLAGK